tara:strand:- start:11978 stop:12832 length:855 start_codon:yes stop_codon:yes gene_type:complete
MPNIQHEVAQGHNPISIKALESHGLLDSNGSLAIAISTDSRIKRAFIHSKVKDCLESLHKAKIYEEAQAACIKLIDLKLKYPSAVMLGRGVESNPVQKDLSMEQKKAAISDMMDSDPEFKAMIEAGGPEDIPLDMREHAVSHYIDLVKKAPLVTKDDFCTTMGGDKYITDLLLDDPDYKSKLVNIVVKTATKSNDVSDLVPAILGLGLSYNEIMMGGYLMGIINGVRQKMYNLPEYDLVKDTCLLNTIYDICVPYSLGIALDEMDYSELEVELRTALKIEQGDV